MHDEDFRNELHEDLRSLWDKLESIHEKQANSADMKIRFKQMVDAYQQKLDGSSRRWWALQPAFQFVIAAILIVGGVFIGRYITPSPPQQSAEVNQLRREVGDLREIVALSLMRQESATDRLRGVSWSNQI